MKILLVSATKTEIAQFTDVLGNPTWVNKHLVKYQNQHHQIDVLITGVGMVFTTFYLSIILANNDYDVAINAGVAGAIDKNIALGRVVNVMDDYFYELGAEDGNKWLSIGELGLLNEDDLPYRIDGIFNNMLIQTPQILALKQVKGQTVNKVHGNLASIETMKTRSNAQIESMEGAAFLYCCLQYQLPNVQVRAISNYVEQRNKANWEMPQAINNLNDFLKKWLNN